ncbi:hypothetical protein EYC84_011064 [Monilinia fructicola]|uniref:Uncharacterized protein n=1 Tax=Monilinia fructicola TaxID=38448 RepID=A0A5M9J700_MONFR|nr:hypothetical protein EYC84_011064 [Monilinia fructicola]
MIPPIPHHETKAFSISITITIPTLHAFLINLSSYRLSLSLLCFALPYFPALLHCYIATLLHCCIAALQPWTLQHPTHQKSHRIDHQQSLFNIANTLPLFLSSSLHT